MNLGPWPLSSVVTYKSVLSTSSGCVRRAEEGTSALSPGET